MTVVNIEEEGEVYLQISVSQYRLMWTYKYNITQTNTTNLINYISRLRRIFYPRFYPVHLFSYLNSWERASIFPFECWVLNKETTGTIFITSLVWGGPWLGIEPGTSRTRSQHSTTRSDPIKTAYYGSQIAIFVDIGSCYSDQLFLKTFFCWSQVWSY